MISITWAIIIALVVAVVAAVAAVAYCRHHSDKCQARIDGILSEKALEISEPMTMVIGPLSLLIKKEPAGTSTRRMLQIALANSERIATIMGLELGGKSWVKKPTAKTEGANASASNPSALSESSSTQKDAQGIGFSMDDMDFTQAMGEALDDATSFMERAQEVVNEHMDESTFDKDTFAIEMYVSPSTLYKRIKLLTGLTPSEYIKEQRLHRALSLLEETDLTVSAISDMCGFSSVAYFGTSFRKRFGITPSDKRKENRDSEEPEGEG